MKFCGLLELREVWSVPYHVWRVPILVVKQTRLWIQSSSVMVMDDRKGIPRMISSVVSMTEKLWRTFFQRLIWIVTTHSSVISCVEVPSAK